ncbi:hypothetical protein GCM10027020_03790 [Nocardioides salsibiostraticola]
MTLEQQARALLAGGPLRQPDRRSCGAATLVFAEMLRNPEYAARIRGGSFAEETLAMHARVTGPADGAGRLQVPWPPALGTPPWAVARHLSSRFDTPYAVRAVRHLIQLDLTVGRAPAALYVGSRWLPRHVVLIVGSDEGTLSIFEPSIGNIVRMPSTGLGRPDWELAGWSYPWFTARTPHCTVRA